MPDSVSRNRNRTATRVDLPAPLTPTTATLPPGGMSRSTLSSASGLPGTYRAQTPRRRIGYGGAGSGIGSVGSTTGSGASRTANTRAADWRTRSSACAANGSPTTTSNAANGVRTATASATPVICPSATAGMPTSSAPHTASPDRRAVRAEPIPAVRAAAAATRVSSASAVVNLSIWASAAPKAMRSGAPWSRSTVAVASSPRAAAARACDRRDKARLRAGTTMPARRSAISRTNPAAENTQPISPTVAAPTTIATTYGGITLNKRSCMVSTSSARRASRSPLRNAGKPPGASRSRRR